MPQTNAISGYPEEIDVLDAASYPADPDPGALKHSKISDALRKLEVELGTNPSGAAATVAQAIASKADGEAVTAALNRKADALLTQNQKTGTAYTLVLGDAGEMIEVNNASANTVTIPAAASVNFAVGTVIALRQYGAGQVNVAPATGVTIRSRGGALKLAGQYAEAALTKRAGDEWVLTGDVVA